MKENYFEVTNQERDDIFHRIEVFLEKIPDLIFAYVHD